MLLSKNIKPNLIALVLSFFSLICLSGQAVALPANFQDETVLNGLLEPVNIAPLPDGRMLVLLKRGEIKIFDPSSIPASSSTYLNIINIESGRERGLASIALDPDFLINNYFYVYYTHGSTGRNRISRFTHEDNTASLSSELMVWQDNENWSDCCHYGGGLDFGPDGKLYLTTGEEFDGDQSQDLTRAGGKIIRINKDGTIPNDNPFFDGPGGNLDEIWAYGLRNPYRASWDILSNRFFFGDVGGNIQSSAREEINLGEEGKNYGWPFFEGVSNDPSHTNPIHDYSHTIATPNGGAVTAGFVYRGSMFPNQYHGVFFFADYALGFINYLEFDATGQQVTGVTQFTNTVNNVVALTEGQDGALYYVDISGKVRRIVYNSGNQPPSITNFDVTPSSGPSPLNVNFTVGATDPENDTLSYHWIFGDGIEVDGGASISHTYNEGVYTAYVEVSDGEKTSLSDPLEIQSGNPPIVQINTPIQGSLFQALDTINFSGSATDPDELLTSANYSWTIRFLHNAHTHPVLNSFIGENGSFQINESGHDYFDNTGYELILTVTDSAGLTGFDSVEIYPNKVNLNISTSPAGQNIFLDGLSLATPLSYDSLIGFKHTVSVLDSYCDVTNGIGYNFDNWSDGGARTHIVTVPSVDVNLVASYLATGSCIGNLITTGLKLQLEPEGIVFTGSDVTGWNDQSGSGNDLNSGGNPQLVIANDLNSSSVVDFDGVDDILDRVGLLNGFPTGNSDRTVFLLAKYRSIGSGGFAYGKNACNQAFGAIVNNTGKLSAQGWCGVNDFTSNTDGTGSGWLVQSIVLSSGVIKHYHNGVLIDTQNHTYNTNLSHLVLGAELSYNNFIDMQVAAVLLYDRALTEQELAFTQDYLNNKYFSGNSLSVNTTSLTDGTINAPYSEFLSASGGVPPYSWSMNNGALPQGLTLDSSTGEISGTPLIPQTANFTVNVTDTPGTTVSSNNLAFTIRDGSGNSPATVLISDPSEGDTKVSTDVLVSYTLSGTGYDHLHLTLDSAPHITITNLTGSYLLTNLSPGPHTVLVELVNEEHIPLGNPESSFSVNFTTELPPNQSPIAVDDSATVDTGAAVAISVLTNDSDPDGTLNTASVTIVTAPVNGSVVDDGNGVLTYTHDGSATSTDSFTYTVDDDQNAVSNTATVSLTIGTLPLVTNGLVLHLEPDQGLTTNGTTVMAWNDQSGLDNHLQSAGDPQAASAPDLNNLTVVDFDGTGDKLERTLSLNGFPSGNSNRTVFLLAKYNSVGFGGFAFGNSSCNQAFGAIVNNTGNLTVQGWCSAFDYSTTTAGTNTGWLIQAITFESGVIRHYKDGVLIDTEPHNYNTILSKLVLGGELKDNTYMDMQVATVLVYDRALSATELQQVDAYLNDKYLTGASTNQPPIAVNDSATVDTGAAVAISVLTNDSDPDGTLNTASVTIVTAPVNGSVVDDGNGVLTYTHDGSATTTDSFTYTVDDDQNAVSNTATVSLTVQSTGSNQSPIAVDDSATVDTGAAVAISVLTNDSDPDGTLNTASVTIVTAPVNGSVVDDGNGVLTYTHDGSATSTDSFTYTVDDDQNAVSNTATVSLTIQSTGSNQSPIAVDDSATVDTGAAVAISVLTNDSDPDGTLNTASVTIVTAPVNGSVVDDGNGVLTYTHDGSATSTDSFTYTVDDDQNAVSNTATVSLTIQSTGSNQSPIAVDDSATVDTGAAVAISVLTNDSDPDGTLNTASVTIVTAPVNGSVVDDGNGVLTYTHDGSATSTDSFTYTVDDDQNAVSNTATVSLTIGTLPLVTNGLVLHLEPDQGLTTNGTTVMAWNDQSGLDNHLQSAGDPQAASAPDLNNLTVVDFDGTGDKLERTLSLNGFPSGNSNRTVFLLAKYNSVGFGGFAFGNSSCNQAFGAIVNNTGNLTVQGWCSAFDYSTTTAGTNTGWLIQAITFESGVIRHYKDGVLIDTEPHNYNTILSKLVLGGELKDNTYMDMQVATVLVYDRALSATELQQVDAYLNDKYLTGASTNQPPIAVNDSATVDTGAAVAISVLTNDSDPDGTLNTASVTIVTAPVNGSVVDDGNGVLTYTHDGSATTTDSFTYTVDDDQNAVSNTATVSLTVQSTGSNQSPIAVDDSATVDTGAAVAISVLTNDSDPDGTLNTASVTIVTAPVNGSVVDDGNGVLTYTHDGSATSTDSFTYTVDDDQNAVSNTATVSLTIQSTGSNQSPIAVDDSATVDTGAAVAISVLTNDSDPDGTLNTASVTIVTAPVNGSVVDDGNGVLTYTHDGSATSTDSFTYTVDDDQNAVSNTATVSLTIGTLPLVTNGLVLHLEPDQGLTTNGTTVMAWNDQSGLDNHLQSAGDPQAASAPDLNNLTVVDFDGTGDKLERTLSLNGFPSGNSNRTVFLLAKYNSVGFGGFAFGNSSCNQAFGAIVNNTGNLTVQGWCSAFDYSTTTAGTNTGWLIQAITFESGVIRHYKDGVLIDTEPHNYNTILSKLVLGGELKDNTYMDMQVATVLVYDRALSATELQQVDAYLNDKYLTGASTNQPPIAVNDSATVDTGAAVAISVLTNDSDPDGTLNTASVTIVTAPVNGSVVDDGNGVLTYTHDGSATTTDSFTYTVDDDQNAVSNTATVSLTVQSTGSNQSPIAVDDSATVDTGAAVAISVLTNDSDPDGTLNTASVTIVTAPVNGSVVDDGNGVLTYTHDGSATSTDSFTYTVDDDQNAVSNTATVSLTIQSTGSNQSPIAVDDSATVDTGAAVAISVLTNDSDPDGTLNTASVTIVTAPVNGSVVDDGNGVLTYTHDGSATSTDSFTYTVDDDQNAVSNTATVSLTIQSTGSNQSPIAVDDSATVDTGAAVAISVLTNDSDPDGTLNTTSVTIVTAPVNGTLVNDGNGILTYTHDGLASSSDSFLYTVKDNQGADSNTAIVGITVTTNQAPTAIDDSAFVVATAGTTDIGILSNDSDTDGALNNSSVTIITAPTNGSLVNNGNGVLTYNHNGSINVYDNFTYTVADNQGKISNIAKVSIGIGVQPIITHGLVLHLETDQGLTTNGTTVLTWNDQSGLDNHLQSAGDPQLVTATDLNNLSVVDFDGTGDKLERTLSINGFPTGNSERTIFLLAKYRSVGYGGFAFGNSSCNQAFGTVVDNIGNLTTQAWCGAFDHRTTTAGTGVGWLIQAIKYDSGVMSHYKDGVLIDTQSHNYNTILNKLVLGGELGDNNYMDMQIATVLVFDRALSTAELQQVDSYLNNKYMAVNGSN